MTEHGNNGQDKEGGEVDEWKMDNARENTGLVAAGTSARRMGAHMSSFVVCCAVCCAPHPRQGAAPDALLEPVCAALPVHLVQPEADQVLIENDEFPPSYFHGGKPGQILLKRGGMGLTRGCKPDIFTPMYLMVGRVQLD